MSRAARVEVGIQKAVAEGFTKYGEFKGVYTDKVKEIKASGLDVRYWYLDCNNADKNQWSWVAYTKPFSSKRSQKKDTENTPKPVESRVDYASLNTKQLKEMCKERKVAGYSKMNKAQMVEALRK